MPPRVNFKKVFVFTILLAVFAGLLGVHYGIRKHYEKSVYEQTCAEAYGNTVPYAYLDYIANGDYLDYNTIRSYAYRIDQSLENLSVTAENDNSRLWIYSFSRNTSAYVTSSKGQANASICVFGGDYFTFHKPKLLAGSYSKDSAEFTSFVVIDELLSWKLFGSYDVVGKTINLDDVPYIICGVIKREDSNKLWTKVYGSEPKAYVLYNSQAYLSEDMSFELMEMMLPNTVKGFALETVSGVFGSSAAIIDHSSLFTYKSMINTAKSISTMAMKTEDLVYPPHENLIAVAEFKASLAFIFEIFYGVLAAISVVVIVSSFWKPMFFHIDEFFTKLKKRI